MDLVTSLGSLVGQTLKTLDRQKPFDIVDVSEVGVLIHLRSTGKDRVVPFKEIEGAYRELTSLGQISRAQIEAHHSPRNPVFVAALLAQLPGVRCTLQPIRLYTR